MEAKEEKMYKTLDLIQINLNNILISDKISTNSKLSLRLNLQKIPKYAKI